MSRAIGLVVSDPGEGFLEANDALRRRRHGRRARTRGAGRCREVDGRSALVGRAVLPADGQRRVRRPALRPRAGLRPGHAGARRQGEGHADPDAGPGPVQPRPARLVRRLARGHRQPAGRVLPGGRAGARDHAAAEAARRPHLHGRGRLSRRARDRRRPRRQLRGLGQEPRRRVRRQRAAGLAGLVPRQRRPERQGDLRLRDHGARGPGRDRQRHPALLRHRRRQDDLALARGLADGELPDDRHQRRLHAHGRHRPERAADLQRDRLRGRCRPTGLHRRAEGDRGAALRRPAADHPGAHRPLGPVPVLERRRGVRPRRRRLRARVAVEADVRRRAVADHGRARARAPVVRRQRDAVGVA